MKIKNKKAVIFGNGSLSEMVTFMLLHDSRYDVVGYTAEADLITTSTYLGKPMVAFEEIEKFFSPNEVEMFIAVGYAKMNQVRERFMFEAKQKGFRLLSYLSSRAQHWGDTKIGENVFIFENNTIQPFVEINDGSILWSGNHIGHHSKIGKYCFITSHAVISGHCHIGNHCFVGVNATIIDNVSIAENNLIGAGVLILKNTKSKEVYAGNRVKALNKESDRFFI